MASGKLRPVWPELVAAVLGVALVLMAPVRIGWIGTVVIFLSVVSAITTLILSKQSAKVQLIGMDYRHHCDCSRPVNRFKGRWGNCDLLAGPCLGVWCGTSDVDPLHLDSSKFES